MNKSDLLAQFTVPGYTTPIQPPSGIPTTSNTSIGQVMGFALGVLMVVAILAAIAFFIWGAISWITSQGDKQKIEKARNTIAAAVIGLIIVVFAFVLISIIGNVVGSNFLGSFAR